MEYTVWSFVNKAKDLQRKMYVLETKIDGFEAKIVTRCQKLVKVKRTKIGELGLDWQPL